MSHFDVIKDRKIRLGIIGCGRVSEKHLDAIEQHLDNIELVCVCDQIKDKADQAAARMNDLSSLCLLSSSLISSTMAWDFFLGILLSFSTKVNIYYFDAKLNAFPS